MKRCCKRLFTVIGFFISVFFGAVGTNPAAAQSTPSDAVAFVRNLSADAITKLASKSISDSERVKRMRKLLSDAFDLDVVGRFVLGRHYRQIDQSQFEEFKKLYLLYVSHNYAGLLKQYSGQRVEVLRALPVDDVTQVVRSLIHQPSGPSFTMDILVQKHGANFKAVDFRVEGVSMPLTHRKEFASIIQRHRQGGVKALISALRQATHRFERETPSE